MNTFPTQFSLFAKSLRILLTIAYGVVSFALVACNGNDNTQAIAPVSEIKNRPENSPHFNLGGQAIGLKGGVILSDGQTEVELTKNGSFVLRDDLSDGTAFNITLKSHPKTQICSISNQIGIINQSDNTAIVVVCSEIVIRAITGDKKIELSWNEVLGATEYRIFRSTSENVPTDGEPLAITKSTSYVDSGLSNGIVYYYRIVVVTANETILSNLSSATPIAQSTNNKTGFVVSGTVRGVINAGLVLELNGVEQQAIANDGSFAFKTSVFEGNSFSITVKTNPTEQRCRIVNGSGVVNRVNIDNISVICTAKHELVSISSDETVMATYYGASFPVISGNGRYIVFVGRVDNLVAGATGAYSQIYLRDRETGETFLISKTNGPNGVQGNNMSDTPAISYDGNYIVYKSFANNLVANDTNNSPDVFLFDRLAQTTQRISVGPEGVEANGESYAPRITGDGNFITFSSYATNLVGSTVGHDGVYVYNRQSGINTLISVALDGTQSSGELPDISFDGSRIVFWSWASNLVPGDDNAVWDMFLYDVNASPKIKLVSVDSYGVQRNQGSESSSGITAPSISADGSIIAYTTTSDNLVANDTGYFRDVFIYRVANGETQRVSVMSNGEQANANSQSDPGRVGLTSDGNLVLFASTATNLSGSAVTGTLNVFIHDVTMRTTTALTSTDLRGSGNTGYSISADGRFVTFGSAGYLDTRYQSSGLFVRDRTIP